MFVLQAPLVLLGLHPAVIAFVFGFNLVWQFWIHTETIGKMWGWFEFIFNTPSHHRVHHATNPRYLDANYAGTLIIWDRMFGTFVEELEEDRPRYGHRQESRHLQSAEGGFPRMDRHVPGCLLAWPDISSAPRLSVRAARMEP
jgi:sterol desaturase/sphingolipid hydroxylase (fatty acid hydroxylase superfamily)